MEAPPRPVKKAASGIPAVVLPCAAVAAIAVLAATVTTQQWAEVFQHPGRQPMPATTIAGAQLWRIMLVVLAASAIIGPWLLAKLRPPSPPGDEAVKPPAPGAAPMSRRSTWAMLALLILALLLRATRLIDSLWYDEIAAWLSIGIHGPGVIVGNLRDPANHIGHTLATWLSVTAFSRYLGDDFALRLPALLASLIAVAAIAALAAAAGARRVAWLAALMMAAAPVAVLEGAEARGYSWMMASAAGGSALWIYALRARERAWVIWLAYAGVAALGVWGHLMTAFVPLGHAAWLAAAVPRRRVPGRVACSAAVALALAAVITLTLLAPALPDLLASSAGYRRAAASQPGLLGEEGAQFLLQLGGSWTPWATLPGLALCLIGVVRVRADARLREAAQLSLAGLPLMLLAVAVSGVWFYARFALFALPGALLLMAAGVDHLWTRRRIAAGTAMAILLAAWMADLATLPPRQPLREAAEHVRTYARPGEPILVIDVAHSVLAVYRDDPAGIGPPLSLHHSLEPHQGLAEQLRKLQPRWVIVLFSQRLTTEELAPLRRAGYTETARFDGWRDWGDVVILSIPPS